MKKSICILLCFVLAFGIVGGCAFEKKAQSAIDSLLTYTAADRENLVSIALPLLLTDSGLDLARDLILNYDPHSNSFYNTLLHPVFRMIDQETALTLVAQMRKVPEKLRSQYLEGFQKREGMALTAETERTLSLLLQDAFETYPGLEQLCCEDKITVPVLARFVGILPALNGGALLTDANATDFKQGKISPLLSGMIQAFPDAPEEMLPEKLAKDLNEKFTSAEKQSLKRALKEIGLYATNGMSGVETGSGTASGPGAEKEEATDLRNGYAFTVLQTDAASGDIIEVAYYKNGVLAPDKAPGGQIKIAIPVHAENAMLYAEGIPVKYTTYADGYLYCRLEQMGTYNLHAVPAYFTDANGWGKQYIESLYHRGIISGKAEGIFDPEAKITREEFVKLVVELFGLTDKTLQSGFADVAADAWYAPYVATAKQHGIVNGVSAVRFGVGEPITRQDMCKILYEMLVKMHLPQQGDAQEILFNDAQTIAEYAQSAVRALVSLRIIQGDNLGNFHPNNHATRQEAAKLIYGMLSLYVR